MARQNLLARAATLLARTPALDTIQRKLEVAEAKAHQAQDAYRIAATAAEAGGDPADETAAEAQLTQARREVTRLQAILQEVEARNVTEARAAQAAREAAEDAQLSASMLWMIADVLKCEVGAMFDGVLGKAGRPRSTDDPEGFGEVGRKFLASNGDLELARAYLAMPPEHKRAFMAAARAYSAAISPKP